MSSDISWLIEDPDFCEPFTIKRRTGDWVDGDFIKKTIDLPVIGVVRPTKGEDLQQLPEGDRIIGAMTFYCKQSMTVGRGDALADLIVWKGNIYKVANVQDWSREGFYVVIATLTGEDNQATEDDANAKP